MYNKFNPDYFPTPMSLIEGMQNYICKGKRNYLRLMV